MLPQIVFEVPSLTGDPNLQITLLDVHNNTVQIDFKNEIDQIIKDDDLTYELDLGKNLTPFLDKFSTSNSFQSDKDIRERSKAIHGKDMDNVYTTSLYDFENDTRGYLVSDPYVIGNTSGYPPPVIPHPYMTETASGSSSMPKSKLSVRELCTLSLLGALMFGAQVVMAPLPNIEPVTLLMMCTAIVYGARAFYPCYVFVLLEGLIYGFGQIGRAHV